ncbi:hypothetical protein BUALT_Bualt07G0099300 [Buddleja alternifolia]|uniref:RING-type E3 ubiquitin transferase n=1 Tax=Buddleja alternifolia TaxID=168488 RepID=A0AAV6XGI8_9LAMI|nr:hypothetical protein BUALT_Bualt07G0099300 [Buddleja alternifolia]
MAFRKVNNAAHFQPVSPLSYHLHQLYSAAASSGCFQLLYAPGYFYVHHDDNVYLMLPNFQNSPNMINGNRPAYQIHNNYQDLGQSYSTPVGLGAEHYYHYNPNPSFIPSTRSNNAWRMATADSGRRAVYDQDRIINNQAYNAEWMPSDGHYVEESNEYFTHTIEEEEAMILNAIELLERENLTTDDNTGDLSEEVISKLLKTSCNKDGDSEMCIVCQDNLGREDEMIGMLNCGHDYHATCIMQWLQEKNICPLHYE